MVTLDTRWPSDNQAGIPTLDLSRQATAIPSPVIQWGSRRGGRKNNIVGAGTLHFYTDDYRFERLWRDPSPVTNSHLGAVVEPNFSVYVDMPPALALYQIWRKRYLARLWQHAGLSVLVDLNVAATYTALNLMGIPKGWRAFATRGYQDWLDDLENQYDIAKTLAKPETPLMFVYGGGEAVAEFCQQHLLWHIPDERTAIRHMKKCLADKESAPAHLAAANKVLRTPQTNIGYPATEAPPPMTAKPWYCSRTLWLNLIAAVLVGLNAALDTFAAFPAFYEFLAAVLPLANAVLRLLTRQPLTRRPQTEMTLT